MQLDLGMAFIEKMFPHPGPPPERSPVSSELELLRCEHVRFRYVRRVLRNGAVRFGMQCRACGHAEPTTWLGARRAAENYQCSPEDWQDFDDDFTREIFVRRIAMYREIRERYRGEHSRAWWAWYGQYLRSGAWQKLRSRILVRDKYMCGACGEAAHEVHHLTYARVGYEDDDDLISVCESCHHKIHGE